MFELLEGYYKANDTFYKILQVCFMDIIFYKDFVLLRMKMVHLEHQMLLEMSFRCKLNTEILVSNLFSYFQSWDLE